MLAGIWLLAYLMTNKVTLVIPIGPFYDEEK